MAIYDYTGTEIPFEDKTDIVKKFTGKNIIILADSIFDYETPDGFNIGYWLNKACGANVYNWAQGGTCMQKGKADNYDPYSFAGMADALATGTFTDQEKYQEDRSFTTQVAEMKAFDMTTADYLIVAYGTNDFWLEVTEAPETNLSDEFDKNTFIGAFNYGIKTLLTKYPTLKILCVGMQRMSQVSGKTGETVTGDAWAEALKEASSKLSVPYVDIYSDSLINKYTIGTLCNGQPHLSHEGKLRYVALIENALNLYY